MHFSEIFFLGGGIGIGIGHFAYLASRRFIVSLLTLKLQQRLGIIGLFLFGIGGGFTLSVVHKPLTLFALMLLLGAGGVFCLAMASHAKNTAEYK